ncbi:MAG: replicative DNA helicase [Myxococcota bacterium]
MSLSRTFGLVPPHDLEAEAAVISAALLEPDARDEALRILRPEHFYAESHATVWSALCDLCEAGKPTDVVTVAAWLRERKKIDAIGGAAELGRLVDGTPAVVHVGAYAELVWRKARRRRMIRVLHELVAQGYGGQLSDPDYDGEVGRKLFAVTGERLYGGGPRPLRDHLVRAVEEIRDIGVKGLRAIPWPIRDLSRHTGGGMRPGELWTVAARPGAGKTSFADQCVAVAAQRHNDGVSGWVLACSLEMTGTEKAMRLLAGESGQALSHLRVGQVDLEAVKAGASRLAALPIFIDDEPADPARIAIEARRLARRAESMGSRLSLVAVDYLQILELPASERRDLVIGEATRTFKRLAKELGCPVLQVAQLNRKVEERKPPRPVLSDLKSSGAIEQDSDGVIFLYRPSYYDEGAGDETELNIAKQRGGPTGVVVARWDGARTRFLDLPPEEAADDRTIDGEERLPW